MNLPPYRLENIYRTNIQNAFNRGRWQKFEEFKASRPYLLYDAINDTRVRPTHLALDGIIRPVGDAFWNVHAPSCGYNCRCRLVSLSEQQAQNRSRADKNGNPQDLNKPVDVEKMKPDKGWNYNPGQDVFGGVERAVDKKLSDGIISPALLPELNKIKTTLTKNITNSGINHKEFSDWVIKVSNPEYKHRHEFMRVGILPDFVIADNDVFTLKPESNEIYISDHQVKHAIRNSKENHGMSLPIDILNQLPEIFTISRWFFDSKKMNLLVVFDTDKTGYLGKSVVEINFKRKKQLINVVLTSGIIQPSDLKGAMYREIIKPP